MAPRAQHQIALCYYKGNRWENAITWFLKIQNQSPQSAIGKRAMLNIAEIYYEQRQYNQAVDLLEKFLKEHKHESAANQDPPANEAKIMLGLCYLQFGNTAWAAEIAGGISSNVPQYSAADALAKAAEHFDEIPRKSPVLAGGLSAVLPGAGQIYAQRPVDAAVAFILNGLLIFATYEAFDNDINVLGGMLAVVELSFWGGNVYNAVNNAHKYNRREKDNFFNKLHLKSGFFTAPSQNAGTTKPAPALFLQYNF
ncbi:MAG: tetratricopeptide repeat protein [Verrucomicrobia bacterium]|nr:tetratricopeptide repeat protein [Verrucomicrobiota bacterium]MBU4365660.1 tetratricopeptide repeat protein [Verrucomicrobiota bacterium]